jgi:hypothetical protein
MKREYWIYGGVGAAALVAYFLYTRNVGVPATGDEATPGVDYSSLVMGGGGQSLVTGTNSVTPAVSTIDTSGAIAAALANINANASMHYSDNATLLFMQLSETLAKAGGGRVSGIMDNDGNQTAVNFGVTLGAPNRPNTFGELFGGVGGWFPSPGGATALNPNPYYSGVPAAFYAGSINPQGSGGGGNAEGPSYGRDGTLADAVTGIGIAAGLMAGGPLGPLGLASFATNQEISLMGALRGLAGLVGVSMPDYSLSDIFGGGPNTSAGPDMSTDPSTDREGTAGGPGAPSGNTGGTDLGYGGETDAGTGYGGEGDGGGSAGGSDGSGDGGGGDSGSAAP